VLFTVATFGTPRIAKVAMAEIHSPDVDAYVNLFGAYYYDSR
jgi:hypothetical protein